MGRRDDEHLHSVMAAKLTVDMQRAWLEKQGLMERALQWMSSELDRMARSVDELRSERTIEVPSMQDLSGPMSDAEPDGRRYPLQPERSSAPREDALATGIWENIRGARVQVLGYALVLYGETPDRDEVGTWAVVAITLNPTRASPPMLVLPAEEFRPDHPMRWRWLGQTVPAT